LITQRLCAKKASVKEIKKRREKTALAACADYRNNLAFKESIDASMRFFKTLDRIA
jgi:hypothetical protein